MEDLLTFLPSEWASYLRVIAEVSFALSLLAAAVKPLLGDPRPGFDPKWKQRVFWLMHFVDWAAVNTATIREKTKRVNAIETERQMKRIRTSSQAGPMFALALALIPSSACAGSQLRTHASIADASYAPITAAKSALERHIAADAAAVKARATSPEDERAQMSALQSSYARTEATFDLTREAYNAYVEAIQGSHATGADIPHEAALALLSRWRAFIEAARAMGLTVPEPPEALRDLGGAP